MSNGIRHKRTRLAMTASHTAFTLVEVLVSIVILAMVMAGVCYGYAQANRIATFCSMQQAAQAFALRGLECARAAKFDPWNLGAVTNTGPDPGGSLMELPPSGFMLMPPTATPVLVTNTLLDIPIKGNPLTDYTYYATNYIYVTWYSSNPPVEMIRSDCVWKFPLTLKKYTNTAVTLRGPDQ
ncbi:MAG TPA: prepilin-type N-terminal cleavage/methylation domain-containing protein [Alphaproteobacteria bacterium]|nr:prepilin-type N-terminal cleavage/methylation domain-containing protein [Alphaproteobacteria bacterium]